MILKKLLTLISSFFKKQPKQVVNKGEQMLKNVSRFEHKIGDRIYHLICEMDSPIEDVKTALHQFMGHIEFIEKKTKQQAEEQPAQGCSEKDNSVPKAE